MAALVNSFKKAKWEESVIDIVYEWLTDDSCFGSQSSGAMLVTGYTTTGIERLEVNRCEFEVVNVMNESTGAGRHGTNSVFRTVMVELTLKASRDDSGSRGAELTLIEQCDTMDTYARSALGIPRLGGAGLRKAKLNGPFKDPDKNYFQRKFMLSFQIEVL